MTQIAKKQSSVALLAALEEIGGVIDSGLHLPPDLPYDRYEDIGAMLGNLHDMSRWLLGDWLNYGEDTYDGDRYAQAAHLTGLAEQTCMNYKSVAKRVPPQRRRRAVKH
jgi:hypothetical protein